MNDEIVAGAAVTLDGWSIHALPGRSGKMLLRIIPHIPFLNRLLNKNHKFLTVEAIYFKVGHEKSLEKFFDHLLGIFKVNSILMAADIQSHLYYGLKSINLGPIHWLNGEVKADVICRTINFSPEEDDMLEKNPAYVAVTDFT